MPTDYRLIVVVRAARKADAEAAARVVDPASEGTFSAPLRFTSSPVTQIDVYMGSWRMQAGQAADLRQALRQNGFSNREIGLVPPGAGVNMNDDLWAFDATEETFNSWTAEAVRNAMGLTFIETVRG